MRGENLKLLVCSVYFKKISHIIIVTTITNSNTFDEIQSSAVCMAQHRCKSVVCNRVCMITGKNVYYDLLWNYMITTKRLT